MRQVRTLLAAGRVEAVAALVALGALTVPGAALGGACAA